MPAESLGELVYKIEADNAQFKAKLKESERVLRATTAKMSASTDKLKASTDKTGAAFGLLDKAAAATGLSFLSQIKAGGELVIALFTMKSSIAATTLAKAADTRSTVANTLALGANTAAVKLNQGARSSGGKGGGGGGGLAGNVAGGAAGSVLGKLGKGAKFLGGKALGVVRSGLGKATVVSAVAAVGVEIAIHLVKLNAIKNTLGDVNKRNAERLATLKKIKDTEAANVKAIQKQSFIARQGLKGNSLELFNARGNSEFGGIKNKAEREATVAHIRLKMRLEKDAVHARQLVAIEEKRIADFKADQAKAAKVLADEEARRAAQLQGRREDAADRDPTTLFNRARFERTQGQVKSQALLQGLIQALKRGANAAGIAGLAGITGNEGVSVGGGRSAGSVALSGISSSLARSGGGLGTQDSELKKQTKLAVDANRLLKALVKKRDATVIGT